MGYSFLGKVAWTLLLLGHRQTDQESETRKEQPCQYLRLHQLSAAIRSRSAHSGNGAVRRALEFARRATTPQSCTPTEAKLPRTNCRGSSMGSKSNSGRLTRLTGGVWSVRFISGIPTLRTTLNDDRRLMIDDLHAFSKELFNHRSAIVNQRWEEHL